MFDWCRRNQSLPQSHKVPCLLRLTHTNTHSFSSVFNVQLSNQNKSSEAERMWGAANVLSISSSRSMVWTERAETVKVVNGSNGSVQLNVQLWVFQPLQRFGQELGLRKQWGSLCEEALRELVATLSRTFPFSSQFSPQLPFRPVRHGCNSLPPTFSCSHTCMETWTHMPTCTYIWLQRMGKNTWNMSFILSFGWVVPNFRKMC